MKKFVVLYNSSMSAGQQMANATPEQMKAGMDAWMAWAQQAGSALVDLGMPLAAAARVSSSGIAETSNQASGYSILQADSKEEITALLQKHPHLMMPEASIDVFETLPMPGM